MKIIRTYRTKPFLDFSTAYSSSRRQFGCGNPQNLKYKEKIKNDNNDNNNNYNNDNNKKNNDNDCNDDNNNNNNDDSNNYNCNINN